jgi:chemotaxis protein MotB
MSGIDAAQFVAVGYGATDPVASNETRAGRKRNRRVRIAVLPTPRDYARPFEMSW